MDRGYSHTYIHTYTHTHKQYIHASAQYWNRDYSPCKGTDPDYSYAYIHTVLEYRFHGPWLLTYIHTYIHTYILTYIHAYTQYWNRDFSPFKGTDPDGKLAIGDKVCMSVCACMYICMYVLMCKWKVGFW